MILKNGKRIDSCSDTVPIGVLSPFLGLTPPNGYLVCQGQLVSKTTYPELYAICGNLFGTATETHFYLPDLRGKTVVGYNSSDTSINTIGKLLGSATHTHTTGNHTLTIDEMPSHNHNVDNYCVGAPAGSAREGEYYTLLKPYGSSVIYPLENAVVNTGEGQAHNHGDTGSATNYQPSLTANWIVKAAMLIPDYFIVENTLDSDNTQNALSAAQGKVLNDRVQTLEEDTGWIKINLINGATDFIPGERQLSYRKVGKVVYLSGAITPPATTSLIAIGVLPEGFRPHYDFESFIIRNGDGYCKAGVNYTGAIWVQNCANAETTFSSTSFIADL